MQIIIRYFYFYLIYFSIFISMCCTKFDCEKICTICFHQIYTHLYKQKLLERSWSMSTGRIFVAATRYPRVKKDVALIIIGTYIGI